MNTNRQHHQLIHRLKFLHFIFAKLQTFAERSEAKSIFFIGATVIVCLMITSCDKTITVRVPADNKWHSMYSIQIPDITVELDVEKITDTSKVECRNKPIPLSTEVRIITVRSFQNYDNLPTRAEDVATGTVDSGAYDLTATRAKRLLRVSTGTEILVRNQDPCAALKVRILKPKKTN